MNALRANPTTGEVFLRLPAPHENIIITPPRESDAADLVLILNDPRVYKFLVGPPIPYRLHHAVGGCPVQHIREVRFDGTELLLGDVSVARNGWTDVTDEDLREKMTKENLEKPDGDHSIVRTIGGALRNAVGLPRAVVLSSADYLRPSHHGKGITSAAVGAVIKQWMVPHLNAPQGPHGCVRGQPWERARV
jgi:hypothetical protein